MFKNFLLKKFTKNNLTKSLCALCYKQTLLTFVNQV